MRERSRTVLEFRSNKERVRAQPLRPATRRVTGLSLTFRMVPPEMAVDPPPHFSSSNKRDDISVSSSAASFEIRVLAELVMAPTAAIRDSFVCSETHPGNVGQL